VPRSRGIASEQEKIEKRGRDKRVVEMNGAREWRLDRERQCRDRSAVVGRVVDKYENY